MLVLNNLNYEVVKDNKGVLNNEELVSLATEYFIDFDYILGDYSYGRLRLKGFYDDKNKKATEINKFSIIEDYVKNYCAPECGYYILKKINK